MDIFYENIKLNENDGNNFRTVFGAFISLIVALVIALYGMKKLVIM